MMRSKERAFTLLEILISMSLFTMIGFAVVLLMRTGVDMWLRGSRGAQQEDRLEQSLPRLEEDLRMVFVPTPRDRIPFDPENPDPEEEPEPLPPDNRFVSGYMTYPISGPDGVKNYRCRYIAFVRDITGLSEIETYAIRAGTNPKAEAYIDGKNDEDEFKNNNHLPTGGAVEVMWIWLPDEEHVGVGTVYRAYRSPIGGKGTLLDPNNFKTMRQVKAIVGDTPMFHDVILFDAFFWTQYTTTWEWRKGQPAVTAPPSTLPPPGKGRAACGPSRTWDSTRGILEPQGEFGFKLSAPPERNSFSFSGDDIWPRMVRIEFALKEEDTVLTATVGSGDRSFSVLSSDFATGRGDISDTLMKIGPEWIRIVGRSGFQRDLFDIESRGERGTFTLAHKEGTPVYYGRVFDFTITIPSYRDDNN